MWKKKTSTKIRCLIKCTLNNTALLNYPPLHPLYASLTGWGVVSSDDSDSYSCTSVGGQLDLQASLLTGTGTAVLAGCFPEASIDTQVLVWITGSQDLDSTLLINWVQALINDTLSLPPLPRNSNFFFVCFYSFTAGGASWWEANRKAAVDVFFATVKLAKCWFDFF